MTRRSDAGDDITQALAKDRLGAVSVLFFVMSAAAPLTVIAGVVTTAYATTQNLYLPVAFVIIGAVLALFSVGYVTMSRHLAHAGAFYAYIGAGLGRIPAVGAAWVSMLSYNMIQVCLYGGIGAAAGPLVEQWTGIEFPWWVFALGAWALVAVLGIFRVDVNGHVLAVLLVLEILLVLMYDASFLAHPASSLELSAWSPVGLFQPGVGAILAIAVTGFVGFESAVVFAEESRKPRRTVPVATYLSVALISALYGLSAWAMQVSAGKEGTLKASPDMLFGLAGEQLGAGMATLGGVLFSTSLIAAMISFHNTSARYVFALGRERVLPSLFGATSSSGAPRAGSLAQTAVALVVIITFAVTGLNPLLKLFYLFSTSGALGILLLLFMCSVAIVAFFAKDRRGESTWHTLVAPLLSIAGTGVVLFLVLNNFAALIGVTEDSVLRWGVPGMFAVVALGGMLYGLVLRSWRPHAYRAIGMGAKSPAVPPQPAMAVPGQAGEAQPRISAAPPPW